MNEDPDAQQLGRFDQKTFDDVLRVNAYAPLRVAHAFLDNVAASQQKKIITLTSRAGPLLSPTRRMTIIATE